MEQCHVDHHIITRKSYLSGSSSFAEYYGQFDSPEVRHAILKVIPMSDLMASRAPHMNDIKLSRWQSIQLPEETRCKLAVANGCEMSSVYSQTGAVCLVKVVATHIISQQLL